MDENLSGLIGGGFPREKATAILDNMAQLAEKGELESHYKFPEYVDAVCNIESHGGKPATRFEDWVTENKDALFN